MKKRIEYLFTFLILFITLNSCCLGAKEEYLGNNLYLSEYDNYDIRILYQEYSCASSGIEIVPMTILEISHNSEWIIVKSGNKRKYSEFKYWVIKNNYENLPDSETVKMNTTEFEKQENFKKFLTENNIELKLKKID